MAKRVITGLLEAHQRGRFASLEYPCDSFLWNLPEAKPLYKGEWQWFSFSLCCRGGDREEWLIVVHPSTSLHAVLHKPECEGLPEVPRQSPSFDIEN